MDGRTAEVEVPAAAEVQGGTTETVAEAEAVVGARAGGDQAEDPERQVAPSP